MTVALFSRREQTVPANDLRYLGTPGLSRATKFWVTTSQTTFTRDIAIRRPVSPTAVRSDDKRQSGRLANGPACFEWNASVYLDETSLSAVGASGRRRVSLVACAVNIFSCDKLQIDVRIGPFERREGKEKVKRGA